MKTIYTTHVAGLTFKFSFNSKCHCKVHIEKIKTKLQKPDIYEDMSVYYQFLVHSDSKLLLLCDIIANTVGLNYLFS